MLLFITYCLFLVLLSKLCLIMCVHAYVLTFNEFFRSDHRDILFKSVDKTKRNILAFTDIFWHKKRPLKYSNLFPDVSIYSSIINIDSRILSNAYRTVLALKIQYIHIYPGDVPVQDISSSSWNVWWASKDSLNFYNVCRTEQERKKSLRGWKRLDNNCERPRRALNTSVWVFLKIPALERGSVGASMCAITLKISLLIFQHSCFSLI